MWSKQWITYRFVSWWHFYQETHSISTFAVAKCSSTASVSLIGRVPSDSVWRDAACIWLLWATWPKLGRSPTNKLQRAGKKQVKRLCKQFHMHFYSRWIQGVFEVFVGLNQMIILWLPSLQHQSRCSFISRAEELFLVLPQRLQFGGV